MNKLELSNIVKRFGSQTPVNGISMAVRDGELAVVVGPSGCGKTTTLRLIAGLEEVTSGEIRLGGEIINHMPPRQRDVAVVFQNYSLYHHLSVRENLGFGLKVRRTPKDEIRAKVAGIAEILHIQHLLDRNASRLSGGEKQRVAIGRALVRNPRLFLMDEPLSNLDAKLRVEMRAEIKKIHRDFGTTSLYVTHDQAEAMSLADRLIVMNQGLIVQEGRPLDVFRNPNHVFVAQFPGQSGREPDSGGTQSIQRRFVFSGRGNLPAGSRGPDQGNRPEPDLAGGAPPGHRVDLRPERLFFRRRQGPGGGILGRGNPGVVEIRPS